MLQGGLHWPHVREPWEAPGDWCAGLTGACCIAGHHFKAELCALRHVEREEEEEVRCGVCDAILGVCDGELEGGVDVGLSVSTPGNVEHVWRHWIHTDILWRSRSTC